MLPDAAAVVATPTAATTTTSAYLLFPAKCLVHALPGTASPVLVV